MQFAELNLKACFADGPYNELAYDAPVGYNEPSLYIDSDERPLPKQKRMPKPREDHPAASKPILVRSDFPETWIWTDDVIEYVLS